MTAIEEEELVKDILATFMMSIEEWQSGIEGTPKPGETDGLDTIYDLTYQGLKNVFSQQHERENRQAATETAHYFLAPMRLIRERLTGKAVTYEIRSFFVDDWVKSQGYKDLDDFKKQLQQQSNGGAHESRNNS